jgi:Fe-S-cluster formation regulator IscX/YfhJ
LATRLRESGKKVMGIGEKKTPLPFITACDKFVYIEILKPKPLPSKSETKQKQSKKESAPLPMNKVDTSLVNLLKESVSDLADETGWTFLGELGNFLQKKKRDFDPRNYGFQKLLPLIKSTDEFDIDIRETTNRNTKHIFVKVKE